MIRIRIIVSLLIITGSIVFAVRHRSFRQLQTEHKQLEQQCEEVSNLQAAAAQRSPAATVSTNTGLSAAERSELLRLRGQIGGLRQELAQETNQLARLSRPAKSPSTSAPGEEVVTRSEAMQRVSMGKQWMIALIMYAEDHQHQLPTTLEEAASFLGTIDAKTAANVENFEYVLPGQTDYNSIKYPARTVVLREKKPWKNTSGRWQRAYAFADGHVELAGSDTGDFTEWEATLTRALQANGQ